MYANVAYLNNQRTEITDTNLPVLVESCGIYRLHTQPSFHTTRPYGRLDYQLLYLASGKAHFFFDKKETILSAGTVILFRPGEPQHYIYYGKEKPEIYWVHFTGKDVKMLLTHYGFENDTNIFRTGTVLDYPFLFQRIIHELQLEQPYGEELLPLILKQILLLCRRLLSKTPGGSHKIQTEIEQAYYFFQENFHTDIRIEEYAVSHHMSPCWFIRNFRMFTGMAPMQYITSLRISNAQTLLENTNYNISEIASIVGYENPLYFSRIFKKHTGNSPSLYRRNLLPSDTT